MREMQVRDHIYGEMIRIQVGSLFPELIEDHTGFGWLFVKAQCWQESRFNPLAQSPAGACGLLQLMPKTAADLGIENVFEPLDNIRVGVAYLADQYRHLGEIPDHRERIRLSLASYNGGRGYINKALELAREDDGLPANYREWVKAGRPAGTWQTWEVVKYCLQIEECFVENAHGRRFWPDWRQMIEYVEHIEQRFHYYLTQQNKTAEVA